MYGNQVESISGARDIIGDVEVFTPVGNVVVRVGKEAPEGGWYQAGYIVLTPAEAKEFAEELLRTMGCGMS